jgi:lipid-A-disaccharide synthase
MFSLSRSVGRTCLVSTYRSSLRPLHVCVLAGEPSGDEIGANLMRSLATLFQQESIINTSNHNNTQFNLKNVHTNTTKSRTNHDIMLTFTGVGGSHMSAASSSFRSLFPMSDLTYMGTTELIQNIPKYCYRGYQIVKHIVKERPNVVVTIDSKGFHTRVVGWTRKWIDYEGGIMPKFIHYVAPSVWAFDKSGGSSSSSSSNNNSSSNNSNRKRTRSQLTTLYDHLCVILPFEEELFDVPTTFVGHPSIDSYMNYAGIDESQPYYDFQKDTAKVQEDTFQDNGNVLQLLKDLRKSNAPSINNTNEKTILLLPGSRLQELKKIMPMMRECMDMYEEKKSFTHSRWTPLVVSAPSMEVEEWLEKYVKEWNEDNKRKYVSSYAPIKCVKQSMLGKYETLNQGNVAMATSGTIVTELGLLEIPTTVVYNASLLTKYFLKKHASVQSVSLINIMNEFNGGKARLVKELLFDDCTSTNMLEEVERMIRREERGDDDGGGSGESMINSKMNQMYEQLLPPSLPSSPIHRLHRPSHIAALTIARVAGVGGICGTSKKQTQQRLYSTTTTACANKKQQNHFTYQTSSPVVTVIGGIVVFLGAGVVLFVGSAVVVGVGILGVRINCLWFI